MSKKEEPTLDELNYMFLVYQEDLAVRERKMKILMRFKEYSFDGLLALLDSIVTPDFLSGDK